MKTVILIYQTDAWHSFSSRELIGIATTEKQRDKIVRKFMREAMYEKPFMSDIKDYVKQIQDNGQTSGMSERYDLEIDTESIILNELYI